MIYTCEKFHNNTWRYMFKGQAGLSPITGQYRPKHWDTGVAPVGTEQAS